MDNANVNIAFNACDGGKDADGNNRQDNDLFSYYQRLFDEELRRPGALGQGPLWFRFMVDPEAPEGITRRMQSFVKRFGEPPRLQQALLGG